MFIVTRLRRMIKGEFQMPDANQHHIQTVIKRHHCHQQHITPAAFSLLAKHPSNPYISLVLQSIHLSRLHKQPWWFFPLFCFSTLRTGCLDLTGFDGRRGTSLKSKVDHFKSWFGVNSVVHAHLFNDLKISCAFIQLCPCRSIILMVCQ